MIYTVTFNPAVDYVMYISDVKAGAVNRSLKENIYFGGKGINVSFVLAQLGVESTALGFIAGFTGKAIEQAVADSGVAADFVHLDNGFSRINVKIKSDYETEINGQGAEIPLDKLDEFFSRLDRISDDDTIVLAGSVPPSLPDDIYVQILERLSGKNIRIVVDAEKNLLMNVLKYKPWLIKPNNHELSRIFGTDFDNAEKIAEYAFKLKEMGAVNVLVSRAEKGAVLVDENDEVHICGVCRGTAKNSVGAGDSMVAGFIAGASEDYEYALKLATASGGATAFSESLAKHDDIYTLLRDL